MNRLYTHISAGAGAVLSAFVLDSIAVMLPWLCVMAALIVADLFAGTMKAIKIGEQVSVSRAVRNTMSKACTYFSAVVCACMIQVAGQFNVDVAKATCTIVCIIEGVSIIGNILKWHGYTIDLGSVLSFVAAKKLGASKDDISAMIKKDEKPKDANV